MCRILVTVLLSGVLGFFVSSINADEVKIGDVVFRESFDADRLPEGWSVSNPKYVLPVENAVQVNLPTDGQDKNASASKQLSVEKLLGTRLKITAKVKANQVAAPPNSWNGIKVMLVLDAPDGKRWLQQNNLFGTFDWKTIRFDVAVPKNATSATLVLGLENTTGQVFIDEIEITVIGKRRPKPKESAETKPVYKGHSLPRLRGAMISAGKFGLEDIRVFGGQWKANLVRWQLTWAGFPNGPADTATVEQFNVWLEEQCQKLDAMLPECEKYGVYVCLDLHTPPGGRLPRTEGSAMRLFRDKKFQDAFVSAWEHLAKRYKNAPMIWSYDLLNEPVEGNLPESVSDNASDKVSENSGILNWRELALKTAKVVRKIDPQKAIVIEAAPWGGPETLEWFEPFDPQEIPNVVYSVHMYVPHQFTHQGVYDAPVGLNYPGEINGKYWDKKALRHALRHTIEFADDYHAAIYIGEFSAIRWAPNGSACRYLKDCIEIFEEEGWDWSYHAFREWDGWSVEHDSDKNNHQPATSPTDRQLLLQSWFEKNKR
ncbi:MAG: glycoside hydrolase family 5 protein [Planctomycetaceae bacterium]|jgi:aryl-phospho-beta-D-glucosidase BglC (GH1 family)|nr:glycoside hydrolase family 5 protein [Planctomycetaceae bacterium]